MPSAAKIGCGLSRLVRKKSDPSQQTKNCEFDSKQIFFKEQIKNRFPNPAFEGY